MNQYLIPANSKKSMLILGYFTLFDLIVFGTGIIFTVTMLFIFDLNSIIMSCIVLAPSLITGFLVMPVPHYHNVMNLIANIYRFYTERSKYFWKGWSVSYDREIERHRRKNF